jgi:guanyl-specific ribonuclease Sa
MKLFLKILFFLLAIFQTNISEAKVFVFDDVVSEIKFTADNVESKNHSNVISENDFAISCKSESDSVDYRNLAMVFKATAAKTSTRFLSTAEGVVHDLQPTLNRIASGGKFPHRNDGSIFKNVEGLLPKQNVGYYREFVHPTPGVNGPGAMRVVTGQNGQMWFTPDHYKTFIPIR